jgi:putative protein-disulfide isomerase
MCSWCYAFQPVLESLQKQLPDTIIVEKIVGGLAPDTQETMPADLQQMIQNTWRKIEQTVPNIHFNFDFWNNNTPIRSTYPACRAVLAAKYQGSEYEDKIINAIQSAYYQLALNPSLTDTLIECAGHSGLNVDQFTIDIDCQYIRQQLSEQLKLTKSLNISSFPSLLLSANDRIIEIQIDYVNHQTMLTKISNGLD